MSIKYPIKERLSLLRIASHLILYEIVHEQQLFDLEEIIVWGQANHLRQLYHLGEDIDEQLQSARQSDFCRKRFDSKYISALPLAVELDARLF